LFHRDESTHLCQRHKRHPNCNLVVCVPPCSSNHYQWARLSPRSIPANLAAQNISNYPVGAVDNLTIDWINCWCMLLANGDMLWKNWILPIWPGTNHIVLFFWVCMRVLNRTSSDLIAARGWDLARLDKSVPCSAGWFGDRLRERSQRQKMWGVWHRREKGREEKKKEKKKTVEKTRVELVISMRIPSLKYIEHWHK
jgi:hypothetical protein